LEAFRVYPPVPFIARELKTDLKLASGDYTLPAGTTVAIATYNLHHSEKIYPNPHKYDPDNFLPERQASRHFYSFIPFSAGPRSCVGRKYAMLKMKIILAQVIREFHITSHLKEKDYRLQADLILKREDGFLIQLEPRKR
jgi:cytochrome P450 family 4